MSQHSYGYPVQKLVNMNVVLGLSTTHDSGASLIKDGKIISAVNEERFNRTKHYGYIPFKSIEYCLTSSDVTSSEIGAIAVPSDILRADSRLLLSNTKSPRNISIQSSSPLKRTALFAGESIKRASDINSQIPSYVSDIEFEDDTTVYLVNHHESHAATAYYCCGHEDALVITLDGLGDRLSGTIWRAEDGKLENLKQWGREGSLGWFYGIVTQALGWWIGNGEGKTMGLASYTDPTSEVKSALRDILPEYEDGELVNGYDFSRVKSFNIQDTNHWMFEESAYVKKLIERYGREVVAASAQNLLEEQVLNIVEPWIQRTGSQHLATAGGIFLNVKINRRILSQTNLSDYFIFPNAGDGGLPTGAALRSYHHDNPKFRPFRLNHAYFGTNIASKLPEHLEERQLQYTNPENITEKCADLLADGKIIAWCQGRMEYGPRALGNRSILIDPTREDSMDRVNKRVKFRDSWRPFAPSLTEESAEEYLVNAEYDPFMITSSQVKEGKKNVIPAVTHVDGTTRPQVVRRDVNESYWELIKAFEERTGVPVLLNTSFNLSGDPIVRTPDDAIKTFYASGLDALAIDDYLVSKQ